MSVTNEDLRSTLFEALKGLQSKTIDVDTARAMAGVGQVIIESAKADIAYVREAGFKIKGNSFFEASNQLTNTETKALAKGKTMIPEDAVLRDEFGNVLEHRVHRLEG